jgi:hypothetical protein
VRLSVEPEAMAVARAAATMVLAAPTLGVGVVLRMRVPSLPIGDPRAAAQALLASLKADPACPCERRMADRPRS